MHETRILAEFAASLTHADIPEATRGQARRLVLDQIGCQIGNAGLAWSQQVLSTITTLGSTGPSSVMGTHHRLRPDDAAFVNSTFGAANEIDDAHLGVRTHPGAVVVPAVLAMAQAADVTSGSDVVTATVVGYEVMLRVAWAGFPLLMQRHHHTPVSAGPFGSAAAAARLLGASAEGMLHTLAIAGSHSGGQMEYTESGGSVKRIHTAIGSTAGVRAAYLAAQGLTGPTSVLEGRRGFLEAFADRSHVDRLVSGLGESFMIDGAGPKAYFAEYRIHAPLQALERLLAEERLTIADIAGIRVGVSSITVEAVGTIVVPTDALGAQFSMRFALAVAAKHGAGRLRAVGEEVLRDEQLAALSQRIELYVHPGVEARKWESFGAVLTVTTVDGTEYTREERDALGTPGNPMNDDQLRDKFRALVDPVLGGSRTEALLDALWNIENADLQTDVLPLASP